MKQKQSKQHFGEKSLNLNPAIGLEHPKLKERYKRTYQKLLK